MKQCKICGKMFIPKRPNKQMCSDECVAASRKISNDKTQERIKLKNRERLGTRICVECGKEFAPRSGTQVCCSPVCQDARTKVLIRSWQNEQREKEQAGKKKRKKPESLAEVNAKAREVGMSYGKYTAYIRSGKEQ